MSDDALVPVSDQENFIDLATQIVSAYVSNNRVPPGELPALLAGVHAAISDLNAPAGKLEDEVEKPTAAQIRKSIRPDGLVSFIDNKTYKTLKRHLTKMALIRGNTVSITAYPATIR